MVGVSSINVAVVANTEAELAAYQGRWDASDRAIGYSAVIRAEIAAGDRAETLLEALSETPAISLAGVAAKLDAILREGQPSKSDAEFPWPQIRAVLQDAVRIGEQTAKLMPKAVSSTPNHSAVSQVSRGGYLTNFSTRE